MAERLRPSWGEAAGFLARVVQRGLQPRAMTPARNFGIDETAFQRRHEYVTVLTDPDHPRVRYVADNRCQGSLDAS